MEVTRFVDQLVRQQEEQKIVTTFLAQHKSQVRLVPVRGDGYCSVSAVVASCRFLLPNDPKVGKARAVSSLHLFLSLLEEIAGLGKT
jgi:hypothetical protein